MVFKTAPTVDRLRELIEEMRPEHRNLLTSLTGAPLLATDEPRLAVESASTWGSQWARDRARERGTVRVSGPSPAF